MHSLAFSDDKESTKVCLSTVLEVPERIVVYTLQSSSGKYCRSPAPTEKHPHNSTLKDERPAARVIG